MPPAPGYKSVVQPGDKYGRWTVLRKAEDYVSPGGTRIAKWHCKCECGTEKEVLQNVLRSGGSRSCGCIQAKVLPEFKKGQLIGRWTILGRDGKTKAWKCKCACGTIRVVGWGSLAEGTSKSCGCLSAELSRARFTKHGVSQHDYYPFYQKIMEHYAQGRAVYPKWIGRPEKFIRWVEKNLGPKPKGAVFVSPDAEKPIEPGNVQWGTRKDVLRAQERVVKMRYKGEILTLLEIEEKTGVSGGTIRRRVERGLSLKEAIAAGNQRMSTETHGLSKHPLYTIYCGIIARCLNPEHAAYASYGGRGITIDPKWLGNPARFIRHIEKHLGPKPTPDHSVDRIDVNGNYEIKNLRWADATTQMRNRRNARTLTYKGKEFHYMDLAEKKGIEPKILLDRVFNLGWSVEKALTTPIRYRSDAPRWKRKKEPHS